MTTWIGRTVTRPTLPNLVSTAPLLFGGYLRQMHVGTVFSQADSGTDAEAIRQWAIAADAAGLHHMMATTTCSERPSSE